MCAVLRKGLMFRVLGWETGENEDQEDKAILAAVVRDGEMVQSTAHQSQHTDPNNAEQHRRLPIACQCLLYDTERDPDLLLQPPDEL